MCHSILTGLYKFIFNVLIVANLQMRPSTNFTLTYAPEIEKKDII